MESDGQLFAAQTIATYSEEIETLQQLSGHHFAVISSCTFLIRKLSDCARAITGAQL